jgi:hypothetical protein
MVDYRIGYSGSVHGFTHGSRNFIKFINIRLSFTYYEIIIYQAKYF